MLLKALKNNRGFTLVELMIVVAIIGILAGIAIPRFVNFLQKSREASTKASLGALRSALTIYYSDTEGSFPLIIAIDPAWPNFLYSLDGFGWEVHPDFTNYLEDVPRCEIGPEGFRGRKAVWHQGLQWAQIIPNPAANDSGWWYFRSSTTAGIVYTGRMYVNVLGIDTKGSAYTSW